MNLETFVIGGIVFAEETGDRLNNVVYDVLEPVDFHDPFCRDVFNAYVELISKDEFATWQNIYTSNKGLQGQIDVVVFVEGFVNTAQMPGATKNLIFRLKEESLSRQFEELMQQKSEGKDVEDKIKITTKRISDFQNKVDSIKSEDTSVIAVNERAEAKPKKAGIKTGFSLVDEYTSGFVPGHLWVLAAYTNVGKTTLACQMVDNACASGAKIDFYSLEMTEEEILSKMKWVSKNTNNADVLSHKLNIITKKTSIEQIVNNFNERSTPDVVFVDYLQLMDFSRGESEYEAMTRISKELQKLSIKKEVCIVVLSQVSNEGAANKNLDVMQLKGSGQIAASADKVLLLRRDIKDELSDDESSNNSYSELVIRKNRQGRKGVQLLNFNKKTGIFTEDQRPGFEQSNF